MAVPSRVKLFFDGGCRPTPIGMETAVVAKGQVYLQRDLGPGTSMDAEWLALIHAVEVAQALGLASPIFLGDSLAVVKQANHEAKCRGTSARHLSTLMKLTGDVTSPHIRHIKRTQNLAGIALARTHTR